MKKGIHRAAGDQQLPYSMQLGSGTYDIPASISYIRAAREMDWGTQLLAKVRLGKNDRDYRLGDRLSISSWLRFNKISFVEPTLKLAYKYWREIDGADKDIQGADPFPFAAAVTNPDLFGGKQVDVILGAKFPLTTAGDSINVEVSKPVYQDLNGPQSKEVLGLSASINTVF